MPDDAFKDDGAGTRDPIVSQALARFKLAAEATKAQRLREREDLRFQVPELQWDEEVRRDRGGQLIDGVPVPARPMLSISKIDQPVQLITNQQRRSHLGVVISPLNEEADDETAEVIGDIYRGIERDSRASLARDWGFDRSTKCGLGGHRAITVYDDQGGHPFDQKIQLKRILNWASVYLDPFAVEPDWSDGQWALIVTDMPFDRYKSTFPKSKLAKMEESELTDLLTDLGNEQPGWMSGEGEARSVRMAEYFYIEYRDRTYVLLDDGSVEFEDEIPPGRVPMEGPEAKTRDYLEPTVHWCKLNAIEKLESTTLPGEHIPIFPSVGKELQPFDGERRWVGVIGPAKDPQRVLNYEFSGAVEKSATAPVSPHIGAEGQFEGHEAKWAQSNTRRFPYLEYKPTALGGNLNPPPQRNVASVDLSNEVYLIEQANDAIQAATFTPDPALGQMNPKDRSGKAIQALQAQSEAGNSNYVQNFAEITIPFESKVILSWIPKYYDRPGRLVRTIKADDSEATVMINQPFVTNPKTKRPVAAPDGMPPPEMMQDPAKPPQVKHYDLKKGVYGVTVTVGKSFQTSRMQGSDALGTLFQHVPQVFPILGPMWMQFQDWPGHAEAAKLLKKMQPPQLQEGPEGEPTVEALQQQIQQAQQAMQAMQQQMGEAVKQIETDQAKQQAAILIAKEKEASAREIEQMKLTAEIEMTRIKAQAQITVEQIKAGMAQARSQFDREIANEELAAEAAGQSQESVDAERQRQFEASQADRGMAHEAGMAADTRGHEAQMAAEQAAREAEIQPEAGA